MDNKINRGSFPYYESEFYENTNILKPKLRSIAPILRDLGFDILEWGMYGKKVSAIHKSKNINFGFENSEKYPDFLSEKDALKIATFLQQNFSQYSIDQYNDCLRVNSGMFGYRRLQLCN